MYTPDNSYKINYIGGNGSIIWSVTGSKDLIAGCALGATLDTMKDTYKGQHITIINPDGNEYKIEPVTRKKIRFKSTASIEPFTIRELINYTITGPYDKERIQLDIHKYGRPGYLWWIEYPATRFYTDPTEKEYTLFTFQSPDLVRGFISACNFAKINYKDYVHGEPYSNYHKFEQYQISY